MTFFHKFHSCILYFPYYFYSVSSSVPMQKFINQSRLAFLIYYDHLKFLLKSNVPLNAIPLIAKVLYLKITFAFYMKLAKFASATVSVPTKQYLSMKDIIIK